MVTPLTVTPVWLRHYADALGAGLDPRRARAEATRLTRVAGKEFARCAISTGTLTVPVCGGAGVLKRRGADPVLSEHGKWRREHLGAWNAAYGRTPFYIHLMPQIEAVYARSEGMTLEEFNTALLEVALTWLDPSILTHPAATPEASLAGSASEASGIPEARLAAVRAEARAQVDASLSIFDALFRLGRDGVFAI